MVQNPTSKQELLDLIYPIGSIYLSLTNSSPQSFLGGIWQRISQGRCLLGANDTTYTVGQHGGEEYHTLTIDEMPAHNHTAIMSLQNSQTLYFANNNDEHVLERATVKNNTGSTSSEYNEPAYTNYTGASQPHNNMPPYLAVYMWHRTA